MGAEAVRWWDLPIWKRLLMIVRGLLALWLVLAAVSSSDGYGGGSATRPAPVGQVFPSGIPLAP